MIWNLLAEEGNTGGSGYMLYALLGVLIVLMIVWWIFSSRKGKQRQKEYMEQIAAIRPGHKVKTNGGICGIVAEVCDDNTIIIETGSENTGKSFVKMDKDCIYQTDAKGPTQLAREEAEAHKKAQKEEKGHKSGAPAEPAEEKSADENFSEAEVQDESEPFKDDEYKS